MNIKKARIIKLVTDDGMMDFKDTIPIGKEYDIDMDTSEVILALNHEHFKFHKKLMAKDIVTGDFLPLELLEIIE